MLTPLPLAKGEAFARATRFSRLQQDLVYVDRLEGEIPLDGTDPPPPPGTDPGEREQITVIVTRILLGVLALGLLVLARRRGPDLWRRVMGGAPGAPRIQRRPAKAPDAPNSGAAPAADLITRLRGMHDHEAALVQLLHAVLPAAAQANGLRLGRAETARDLMRRIPPDWPNRADLGRIVMAEELVQFGGRVLSRQALEECLDRAAPILELRA